MFNSTCDYVCLNCNLYLIDATSSLASTFLLLELGLQERCLCCGCLQGSRLAGGKSK